jgi:hypothetical protein
LWGKHSSVEPAGHCFREKHSDVEPAENCFEEKHINAEPAENCLGEKHSNAEPAGHCFYQNTSMLDQRGINEKCKNLIRRWLKTRRRQTATYGSRREKRYLNTCLS